MYDGDYVETLKSSPSDLTECPPHSGHALHTHQEGRHVFRHHRCGSLGGVEGVDLTGDPGRSGGDVHQADVLSAGQYMAAAHGLSQGVCTSLHLHATE